MTSLLATRRRAEDFARLVDERRQSRDPKIVPLLDLVAALTPAMIEPAPAFRSSLRERLVSAAEEMPLGEPAAPTHVARSAVRPPRVRLVAAAASVALAGGMVGTAAAARTALPGDVLYGLKRSLERTEAGFTSNTESRGRHFLRQAEVRLDETVSLVGGASLNSAEPEELDLVRGTLSDFVVEAKRGGGLLTQAYRLDHRQAPLVIIRHFVSEARPKLEALQQFLPPTLMPSYDEAMNTLDGLDDTALSLCPDCGTNPTGGEVTLLSAEAPPPSSDSAPAPAPEKKDATSPAPTPNLDGIPTVPPGPFPPGPRPGPTTEPGPRDPGPTKAPLPIPPLPNPIPTSPDVPLPTELPLPTSLPLPLPSGFPLPLPTAIPLPLPTSLPLPLPPELPLPTSLPLPLPTSLPLPLPLPGDDLIDGKKPKSPAPTDPRADLLVVVGQRSTVPGAPGPADPRRQLGALQCSTHLSTNRDLEALPRCRPRSVGEAIQRTSRRRRAGGRAAARTGCAGSSRVPGRSDRTPASGRPPPPGRSRWSTRVRRTR